MNATVTAIAVSVTASTFLQTAKFLLVAIAHTPACIC
jgi:hypothetical protein